MAASRRLILTHFVTATGRVTHLNVTIPAIPARRYCADLVELIAYPNC